MTSDKVKFIAEVSSNHNQDIDRCFAFIDKAAEIGCDAVKFQLFKIEELFAPEILSKSEEHRQRKMWELPVEFLPALADRCREAGCKNLTLLHCVSGYPTPINECNLAAIQTLRAFLCSLPQAPCALLHAPCSKPQAPCFSVGWSDHTEIPGVIYRAIHRWEAEVIEFHLDLDGTGEEYKAGHCWLPDQIKAVIEIVQAGFQCDGTGEKTPAPSELSDRNWRADSTDGLRPILKTRVEWKRQ